jgi:hypothetical protein
MLLLRTDHLMAEGRAAALSWASEISMCCWRPTWIPGTEDTSGRRAFLWVRWDRGSSGPPVHRFRALDDLDQLNLPLGG